MAYSFTVSYIILYGLDLVPWFKLRVDEKSELDGLDYSQIGEYAFEALTEKESKWGIADFVGEAEATDNGGIISR